jgi:hypothetical protein
MSRYICADATHALKMPLDIRVHVFMSTPVLFHAEWSVREHRQPTGE